MTPCAVRAFGRPMRELGDGVFPKRHRRNKQACAGRKRFAISAPQERDSMIMKKNLAKSLLCAALAIALLTGCSLGSYQTNPGAIDGNTPSGSGTGNTASPNDPTNDLTPTPAQTPYTVRLLHNNEPFAPADYEDMRVVWHSQTNDYVFPLESDGTASAGVLDGDFDIYLTGLPSQYSYNPNIYHVDSDTRHVDIFIVDITEPDSGDGGINAPGNTGLYTNGGCFEVTMQGTYRVTCYEPDQTYYFQYQPTTAGLYSIESWCNVYEDEVNPVVDIYTGTVGAKFFSETRDGGGPSLSGGYTKNFRYEISLSSKYVANTYTFGVRAYSKSGEYPVTVEFAITYEGAVPDEKTVKVDYQEVLNRVDKADDSSETYNYADLGDRVFDLSYKLDDDGYYCVYDEQLYADNGGFGPRILCDLMNMTPCYTVTSIYDANAVQGSGNNYLRLRKWSDEEQSVLSHDFTNYIRKGYAAKVNSDGRCYVTEDLREFLQLFAEQKNLWTDGMDAVEGTPEENLYSANQDDMWLFACGFYENGR